MDHTRVLTPLTTKEADKAWPGWLPEHHAAFEAIKALVVSRECLTTIDHQNMGNNKIFIHSDASNWRTGAVLSYGPTKDSARPVAYDSMQLKGPELNYPVHEKELLAIVRALHKWRVDLIGVYFEVFTDHERLLRIVSGLTEKHEASRAEPWAVSDAPADYIEKMLNGIVGFALPIARLEGKRKLNQNRSAEDIAGVSKGLAQSPNPSDQHIAQLMSQGTPRV